jgi:hypothetical protein
MDIFWDVAPCSIVDNDDILGVLAAAIIRALIMDEVCTSNISASFFKLILT